MANLDLLLEFGGDLVLTANGSIQTATGWDQVRERILRNLITNPLQTLPSGRITQPDYIFHVDYGFGAGSLVGQDVTVGFLEDLQSRIQTACSNDVAVDSSVPASVKFQEPSPGLLIVTISVLLLNGQSGQVSLSFGG